MAIDLLFDVFFGVLSPVNFVSSPATLPSWNTILAEVDKINSRKRFSDNPYEFHIWADDSNKGGSDRHVVGVHNWNSELAMPQGIILRYSLISSGSGKRSIYC